MPNMPQMCAREPWHMLDRTREPGDSNATTFESRRGTVSPNGSYLEGRVDKPLGSGLDVCRAVSSPAVLAATAGAQKFLWRFPPAHQRYQPACGRNVHPITACPWPCRSAPC